MKTARVYCCPCWPLRRPPGQSTQSANAPNPAEFAKAVDRINIDEMHLMREGLPRLSQLTRSGLSDESDLESSHLAPASAEVALVPIDDEQSTVMSQQAPQQSFKDTPSPLVTPRGNVSLEQSGHVASESDGCLSRALQEPSVAMAFAENSCATATPSARVRRRPAMPSFCNPQRLPAPLHAHGAASPDGLRPLGQPRSPPAPLCLHTAAASKSVAAMADEPQARSLDEESEMVLLPSSKFTGAMTHRRSHLYLAEDSERAPTRAKATNQLTNRPGVRRGSVERPKSMRRLASVSSSGGSTGRLVGMNAHPSAAQVAMDVLAEDRTSQRL